MSPTAKKPPDFSGFLTSLTVSDSNDAPVASSRFLKPSSSMLHRTWTRGGGHRNCADLALSFLRQSDSLHADENIEQWSNEDFSFLDQGKSSVDCIDSLHDSSVDTVRICTCHITHASSANVPGDLARSATFFQLAKNNRRIRNPVWL